jgi:hypothetical protein
VGFSSGAPFKDLLLIYLLIRAREKSNMKNISFVPMFTGDRGCGIRQRTKEMTGAA